MVFGDLKTAAGLKSLNDFLGDKSYIEGYAYLAVQVRFNIRRERVTRVALTKSTMLCRLHIVCKVEHECSLASCRAFFIRIALCVISSVPYILC